MIPPIITIMVANYSVVPRDNASCESSTIKSIQRPRLFKIAPDDSTKYYMCS